MARTFVRAAALAVAVTSTVTRHAAAHTRGLSLGSYTWRAGEVEVTLAFSRAELTSSLPVVIAGDRSWVALLANERHASAWITERLDVRADGARCPEASHRMRLDGDGVALDLLVTCAPPELAGEVAELTIVARFAGELSPEHRHVVTAVGPRGRIERVLTAGEPALTVALAERAPVRGAALAAAAAIVVIGLAVSWAQARARARA